VTKFTAASKDFNKFKNRLVNVLPCKLTCSECNKVVLNANVLYTDDHCRVLLEGKPGDEGSDYINASYIDVRSWCVGGV